MGEEHDGQTARVRSLMGRHVPGTAKGGQCGWSKGQLGDREQII